MSRTTMPTTRVRRRTSLLALIVAVAVFGAAGAAFAFWTATASGNAAARAGSLSAPTNPTATADSANQITVGWTLPGTQLAGAQHWVTRTSGPGSPTTVCIVPSNGASCADTGLTGGTAYGYSIIAFLDNWQTTAITASTSTLNADGSGTLTTPTTSVTAGSTGNTVTFTYTAASVMTNGSVTLAVPAGWSAPSTTGTAEGFTTASTGTVGTVGQTITVSGVTLSAGGTLTIEYGSTASAGPGATAPTSAGAQTWQAQQKSTSGGTLTNLASSPSITVTAGAATKLAFTIQPTSGQNIQATGTGTFNVAVAVQDTNGNTVLTDTRNVTLAIGSNPSAGVLSCTSPASLTVAAVSGVANFTGCAITKVGTGYTLSATSSPALTAPANANSFNITAGTAASLVLAAATTTPAPGAADNLTITARDANGNTATGYTGAKSLTFAGATVSPNGTNPTVSDNTGVARNFGVATTITFASGVASVSGANNGVMKLYKAETTNITVTDGTINNNPGLSVTVTAGSASVARLSNCVVNTVSVACTSPFLLGNSPGNIKANVAVTDTYGNTPAATTVSFTITSPSGNYPVSGSPVTITAGTTSTTQFTVTHANNASNSAIITVHATSGSYADFTFTVQKN